MPQTKSKVPSKNALAGGIAGAIEATIMYPAEYIKTQLQLQARSASGTVKHNGILEMARHVVKGLLIKPHGL